MPLLETITELCLYCNWEHFSELCGFHASALYPEQERSEQPAMIIWFLTAVKKAVSRKTACSARGKLLDEWENMAADRYDYLCACRVAYDNVPGAGMKPLVELGFIPPKLSKSEFQGHSFTMKP